MPKRYRSFALRRRRTEKAQGMLRLLRLFGIAFVAYLLLHTIFVDTVKTGSASMLPTLLPGDRVVILPFIYGGSIPLVEARLPGLRRPRRGDLAVISPPYAPSRRIFAGALNELVSFLTLRLYNPELGLPVVRRVIAVPGDIVSMEGYRFRVRSREEGLRNEFELAGRHYRLQSPIDTPRGWDERHPFSGRMEPLAIGAEEYFVAADNRGAGLDSRHWGTVPSESILAWVWGRYWPLSRLGGLQE